MTSKRIDQICHVCCQEVIECEDYIHTILRMHLTSLLSYDDECPRHIRHQEAGINSDRRQEVHGVRCRWPGAIPYLVVLYPFLVNGFFSFRLIRMAGVAVYIARQ